MATDISILYSPIWIGMFLNSLSWHRILLARYFKKYKVSVQEYEKWLFKNI